MNRSITKTLLRKTQRSCSWLMIGVGLLVIGFGISLWLRQVSLTHAQSPNIFDTGRSNYFGRGESRNVDTVLPEIYDYREQSGGGLRSYAVNVRELTGLSDAVLHSLYNKTDGSAAEINVGSFFNNIDAKLMQIENDEQDYGAYKSRNNAGQYPTPVDACIEKQVGRVGSLVSESQYNQYYGSCKSWLITGYRFVQ